MRVRLLTSAKSREKGTDETLREIEATGLGRLSSFPSVNFLPSEFLSHFFLNIKILCPRLSSYSLNTETGGAPQLIRGGACVCWHFQACCSVKERADPEPVLADLRHSPHYCCGLDAEFHSSSDGDVWGSAQPSS